MWILYFRVELKATIVTADPEFKKVEDLVEIGWIRWEALTQARND